MLDALLPPDTYFRFNPLMNEDIPLDESRKEKLSQLQTDGIRYLERNEEKLRKAAKILTQEKTTLQRLQDWIRLKADMYEGLPFLSKLWIRDAWQIVNVNSVPENPFSAVEEECSLGVNNTYTKAVRTLEKAI